LAETRLRDQVDNALDETRMLVLGAQVTLGFQFQAAFQSGFDKLSEQARDLTLIGLVLMLIAVGLLLAPGAYHQIVERGDDSPRLIGFTNGIAALALLPFALGMSIDVYITTSVVLGAAGATAFALGAAAFALFFWYALELVLRRGQGRPPPMEETDLSTRIKQVLTEARVVLPGAQALLGFQFIAVLTESFTALPPRSQYVHLASLGLMVVAIVLLMAPAAFHRIVEHGQDAPRVHTFASIMLLGAMVPLALGIAGDSYVVVLKVAQSETLAVATAGLALLFFYGLWFGVTLAIRAAR
jgi:TRAP-type C4-dicarboxylate transport system permease small subunit